MIDTIGWIVTVNMVILCVTVWKCAHMKWKLVADQLNEDKRQFDILNLVPNDYESDGE